MKQFSLELPVDKKGVRLKRRRALLTLSHDKKVNLRDFPIIHKKSIDIIEHSVFLSGKI